MKRLVEYPVAAEPGQTVLVEVEETLPEGEERAARGTIERFDRSLDDALERVKPAASALVAKVRGLAVPPDEATVEFGIKLGGKAGVAVLAAAAVEANYKVTLTWRGGDTK